MNELVQLGLDLYYGKVTKFSKEEANEAFRKALVEMCGGKLDYKSMRKHGADVFNLIEETIDAILPNVLDGQFDQFVETKNTAWGDQLVFETSDPSLFKIAVISNGTTDLRRQRLDGGSLTLTTKMNGVKIYEEFYRFASGRIDWVKMVDRVISSFALKIKTDVYNAIYGAYAGLASSYQASGTFSPASFNALVAHVQAGTNNMDVTCFGTKLALSKITASAGFTSYNMMDAVNKQGYLGEFQGTKLVQIEQAHTPGTDNFAISDNFLLLVPTGAEKIVKLGFEGDAIIKESEALANVDMSMEYTFMKQYGVGVLASGKVIAV